VAIHQIGILTNKLPEAACDRRHRAATKGLVAM
jgi:hypothetical protein